MHPVRRGTAMLEVRGLSLRYPNGKQALTDFSLAVAAGELVIVLGGNGSGKTTLLRCIARALVPGAGTIRVNGTDLTRLPATGCAAPGSSWR